MREIKRSEIVMWKCPTCGSRNKIYTILHNRCGKRIGSTLKCCDCGTLLKRLNDLGATITDEVSQSYPGKQYCIKLHKCDKCATCPLKKKPEPPPKPDCDCNCDCCKRNCYKKQKCNQLIIKVNKICKFK